MRILIYGCLQVLEQVSPKLEDQVCTSGMKHPERNRPGHDLPGDY